MARYEFKLPDIGEGIAEAEIVAWHVKVGDRIEEDAPLADMMTDKATVEMESPVAGTVIALAGAAGDRVPIGSVLAVLETEAEDKPGAAPSVRSDEVPLADGPLAEDAAPVEPSFAVGESDRRSGDRRQDGRRGRSDRRAAVRDGEDRRRGERRDGDRRHEATDGRSPPVLASPAVRQRARDLGIDLAAVPIASGDRVRHSDLDAFLFRSGAVPVSAGASRADEEIKVIGLRRRIAENLQEAKRRIPHFTYVEEVDVTALEATRAMLNADRGDRPRLTLLPLLITAMCRAIARYPQVNARFDDERDVLVRSGAVHMGMATQTDLGLMVPVIRSAESRNVWDLAAEIGRLSDGARAGTAGRDELSGSTITISSLGALGGIVSTPVVNRPEVAIVAVNKVVERPVVIEGKVEIRKMMNLSSSFDHRVVDGWDAASFVQEMKGLLENPLRLLA